MCEDKSPIKETLNSEVFKKYHQKMYDKVKKLRFKAVDRINLEVLNKMSADLTKQFVKKNTLEYEELYKMVYKTFLMMVSGSIKDHLKDVVAQERK